MHLSLEGVRYLVVGAGFYGAVVAEHIARQLDERVVVIESRDHLGGNCHSQTDPETGIEFHTYGTHIFHTSNPRVWDYLQRFTDLNGYRHQVLATWQGRVYQMPINLETINSFFALNLKPYEVEAFLADEVGADAVAEPRNLEEQAVALVGRRLYEAFVRGYTEKQWGRSARELPASIIRRLPFRRNYDESYYFDRWQGIPSAGYTAIFEQMLDHPNIEVHLNVDFMDLKQAVPPTCLVIYTGPIDRFFHHAAFRARGRARRRLPGHLRDELHRG
jgi:UDP-galactopyranose mutase